MKTVFLVIQTRNVPATDYVVAVCATKEIAEQWVRLNCGDYGDCFVPITQQFIPPRTYQEYADGKWVFYKDDKPALLIQEYKFHDNYNEVTKPLHLKYVSKFDKT